MKEINLWDLFAKTAQTYPDLEALQYFVRSNGTYFCITYSALYKESLRICELLLKFKSLYGLSNLGIIVVAGETNPAVISIILGIISKFAFFYISTDFTSKEINRSLSKINPLLIIKLMSFKHHFHDYKCDLNFEVQTLFNWDFQILTKLECKDIIFLPELAFAISTSGSTGIPKLVYVPHSCIIPNIMDLSEKFNINCSDIVLNASPLTFDPSIIEFFIAFARGASVVMVPREVCYMPIILYEIIKTKITVLQITPTLFSMLTPIISESDKLPLHILALGGESFPKMLYIEKWKKTAKYLRVFNLYGITELSCWSSCLEINVHSDYSYLNGNVSLGSPLSETVIKVCDASGNDITNGDGEIIVGSYTRYCWIDIEFNELPNCMNKTENTLTYYSTGDIGTVKKGNLYYKGRYDSIIKRNGKKISLNEISTTCTEMKEVLNCCTFDFPHFGICLFACRTAVVLTEEAIWEHLKISLAEWKLPSKVIILKSIPSNHHGKLDKSRLFNIVSNMYRMSSVKSYHTVLKELWCKYLGQTSVKSVNNFIQCGGNSLQALAISEEIQLIYNLSINNLFDIILNNKFEDILFALKSREKNYDSYLEKTFTADVNYPENTSKNFKIVCRFGNYIKNTSQKSSFDKFPCNINISWQYNLQKCVDASPLLVAFNDHSLIYIGSHAHRFVALDSETGKEAWNITLSDRIESSAAISADHKCVYIGCYSGHMYCVDSISGLVVWTFTTDGEIKSSPCISPTTGNIIFGCHDKYLYSVTVKGNLAWKCKISAGSIFSSPYLRQNLVYVATLDGIIACLNEFAGAVIWKKVIGMPIFSSINGCSVGIVFGCVDCCLYLFSYTGNFLWKFRTDEPIFSSPYVLVTSNAEIIAFGSHDCNLYFINKSNDLLYKFHTTSAIYATPFLATHKSGSTVACICEISGVVHLLELNLMCVDSDKSNVILNSFSKKFDGNIFSSPIMCNEKIYFGCRNNIFYCISLD